MDIFDIIGPVMIGPSSSHTAGAAKIGLVARRLLDAEVERARIGLFGSFALTGQGHGTDRAIIAGLMGMSVDDVRLRDSLKLAHDAGLEYEFYTIDALRGAHPNTAVIEAWGSGRKVHLQAASTGGGVIRVERLGGVRVDFSGANNTLIISHMDERGLIAQVSGLLAGQSINIATMQVFRTTPGGEAVMVIEVDEPPSEACIACLRCVKNVRSVSLLKKL